MCMSYLFYARKRQLVVFELCGIGAHLLDLRLLFPPESFEFLGLRLQRLCCRGAGWLVAACAAGIGVRRRQVASLRYIERYIMKSSRHHAALPRFRSLRVA